MNQQTMKSLPFCKFVRGSCDDSRALGEMYMVSDVGLGFHKFYEKSSEVVVISFSMGFHYLKRFPK
ncbi:hypothetical protein BCU70_21420 [Vibrio sp. 10N.286.49.C2]|nr:hypothetical protein BCU70_21420 [Vibrio sp. 10N.286.49.C2]PMH47964.1 hypothetical protein BCU66_21685 [Vibrio sp. 10N.286.49.B1]